MPEFAQYLGACCRSATNRRRIRGFFDTLLRKTVLTGHVRAFLARRGRPTHDRAPWCDSPPSARGESMKLVRFGPRGREKPGIIDSKGAIRDLSKVVPDIAGEALSPKGLAKIRKAPIDKLPLVRGNPRLGPCVGGIGNLIAIGLNYSDHAAETGSPIPKEPIIFNKVTSCICGPNDDTIIPKESSKLDWEVELAIVIGQRARYLSKDKALDVVAGYCLANDVSERVL